MIWEDSHEYERFDKLRIRSISDAENIFIRLRIGEV